MPFILQSAQQASEFLTSARDATLVGTLITAVGVLWKNTSQKDKQLLETTRMVVEALGQAASSNQELRKIIEQSVASKVELTEAIKELSVEMRSKPCLAEGLFESGVLRQVKKT